MKSTKKPQRKRLVNKCDIPKGVDPKKRKRSNDIDDYSIPMKKRTTSNIKKQASRKSNPTTLDPRTINQQLLAFDITDHTN